MSAAPHHSLLDLVRRANGFSLATEEDIIYPTRAERVGWSLQATDNVIIGYIQPEVRRHLSAHPEVFEVQEHCVRIHSSLTTADARTEAVERVLLEFRNESSRDHPLFGCLHGWRNERYDVHNGKGVYMRVERAAAGLLGVRSYGCHLNGYVRDPATGAIKMWIARRSATKQTYPNMLDNLVGGGLAAGVHPYKNIIKECHEEAGLDPATVKAGLRSVGAISFFLDDAKRGWVPDTEYVYDMELSTHFAPRAVDGEVQAFYLMDLDTVQAHLHRGEFMPESGLVIIEFLIRFGVITASNEPDYVEIIMGMHRKLRAPGPRFTA
ncbi:uncharacterized protein EV422DRAFT_320762 [Fimicolochytrium jonesii]|uniref:uncharacterized protein n=1 Tax=Fimicolochytrium jonesii TaxID=1396493 RepID=UPI0022FE72D9|nr:uncharacterized protein EV422DRAFT_320762 [Fimicolochytrium jonesii]KAI8824442.1 hypothetical protein EV422DRAFT_320762 [Fimicolochytrium jonesii]